MVKRLLIIPAKSTSKRVKNKNVKKFYNKPIIFYSIKNALKSKLFSKVHISTESNKIKKLVESYGIKIDFLRPKKLCKNNTPIIEVMKYVQKQYERAGEKYNEIWNLSACSPLISYLDLKKASQKFKKNKILISVARYNAPVEWAFNKNFKHFLKPINYKKLMENSQNFKDQFHDTGNFAIFSNQILKKNKLNLKNIFMGYEIPRHRAVDIDNLSDWKLAEKLYKIS